MILTIRTINQEKSRKATSWAVLLVTSLARYWLSLGLSDEELREGVQITLWTAKGRIKPLRTEPTQARRDTVEQIHARVDI